MAGVGMVGVGMAEEADTVVVVVEVTAAAVVAVGEDFTAVAEVDKVAAVAAAACMPAAEGVKAATQVAASMLVAGAVVNRPVGPSTREAVARAVAVEEVVS